MQVILLLPLVALCFWVDAERRLGFVARLITGAACIVVTGFACSFYAKFLPRIESHSHRVSFRLAGELIDKGDTQRVAQAIQAYNHAAAGGNTYAGAQEMWRVLNRESKP